MTEGNVKGRGGRKRRKGRNWGRRSGKRDKKGNGRVKMEGMVMKKWQRARQKEGKEREKLE